MKKFINNLKRILSFLERKRYLAVLFILMIFRMVFVIGIPIFSSKKVVYITNNMLYQLVILMLFLTVAGILECIVNLINNFFLEKISTEVSSSLQKSLSKEIIKLDDETINRVSSGEIIQRINNDVPTLNNSVVSFYKDFYRLLVFIGYFIGTTIISIHIALFFAVFIIILIFLRKWNMNLLIKDKKVKLHFGEILTGKFNEMCRGVEDLKILNSEKSYLNNVSSNINDYNNFTYKMNMSSYERDNFIAFFRSSNLFLFYCLIIYLITIDNINITNALVAVYFFSRITNFSSSLTNLFKDITDVNLYSERIFNIFDGIGYTKETFGNKHLDKVVGDFEFKHVNFSYVDGKPILKDMSFKIKHDTTVGFVGKSGIGKTTVFNLLCKLYTPSSGNIYIDNVDINDLDRESIRGNIKSDNL